MLVLDVAELESKDVEGKVCCLVSLRLSKGSASASSSKMMRAPASSSSLFGVVMLIFTRGGAGRISLQKQSAAVEHLINFEGSCFSSTHPSCVFPSRK